MNGNAIDPKAKANGQNINGPIANAINVKKYLTNKFLMHILSE